MKLRLFFNLFCVAFLSMIGSSTFSADEPIKAGAFTYKNVPNTTWLAIKEENIVLVVEQGGTNAIVTTYTEENIKEKIKAIKEKFKQSYPFQGAELSDSAKTIGSVKYRAIIFKSLRQSAFLYLVVAGKNIMTVEVSLNTDNLSLIEGLEKVLGAIQASEPITTPDPDASEQGTQQTEPVAVATTPPTTTPPTTTPPTTTPPTTMPPTQATEPATQTTPTPTTTPPVIAVVPTPATTQPTQTAQQTQTVAPTQTLAPAMVTRTQIREEGLFSNKIYSSVYKLKLGMQYNQVIELMNNEPIVVFQTNMIRQLLLYQFRLLNINSIWITRYADTLANDNAFKIVALTSGNKMLTLYFYYNVLYSIKLRIENAINNEFNNSVSAIIADNSAIESGEIKRFTFGRRFTMKLDWKTFIEYTSYGYDNSTELVFFWKNVASDINNNIRRYLFPTTQTRVEANERRIWFD